jgi:hypothetical protein
MDVHIYRHRKEWIVLTEDLEVTFHQTLAGAMEHASAAVRSPVDHGSLEESYFPLHDC